MVNPGNNGADGTSTPWRRYLDHSRRWPPGPRPLPGAWLNFTVRTMQMDELRSIGADLGLIVPDPIGPFVRAGAPERLILSAPLTP